VQKKKKEEAEMEKLNLEDRCCPHCGSNYLDSGGRVIVLEETFDSRQRLLVSVCFDCSRQPGLIAPTLAAGLFSIGFKNDAIEYIIGELRRKGRINF